MLIGYCYCRFNVPMTLKEKGVAAEESLRKGKKGTLQLRVSIQHAVTAEIGMYDRLFTMNSRTNIR